MTGSGLCKSRTASAGSNIISESMKSRESKPSTHRLAGADVAGDVDGGGPLGAIDADAILVLEPPQTMVAIQLDEPGDRDVDDMAARVEGRQPTGGPTARSRGPRWDGRGGKAASVA